MKQGRYLFALLLLSGCSLVSGNDEIRRIATSPVDDTLPFSLSVLEEVNDGERLHVLAAVESKGWWDLRNVVLRLVSVKAGEISGESLFPLANLVDHNSFTDEEANFLRPGDEKKVSISVPSTGMTDYQIDLLWGKEAAAYLTKAKDDASSKGKVVTVRGIELDSSDSSCKSPPCSHRVTVKGELVNEGENPVKGLQIGVSVAWVLEGSKLDLSSYIPENEEKIDLPELALIPGQSQPFSIAIDRELPDTSGGRFEPVVRVIQ